MKEQQMDRQKDLMIGFARTLIQCADSGNQVLTDCAFENLVNSVNSYIALCQFGNDVLD
jgi:hypothetical protein